MGSLTNNLIISITGFTLLLLVGAGVREPKLFQSQGYSNLTSLLIGGLLGVVSSQNTQPTAPKQEDDDYRIK